MDGINPTLGFAAIFLGLAGHPRDAAETQIEQPQMEQPAEPQCAPFAATLRGPETDAGGLENAAASPVFLEPPIFLDPPVFLDPIDGRSARFEPFENRLPMMAGRFVVGPMQGAQAAAAGPYQVNVDLNVEALRAFRAVAASGSSGMPDCPSVAPVP